MSSFRYMISVRNVTVLLAALAMSLGLASAQLSTSHGPSFAPSATESSSNTLQLDADTDALVSAALPAAPGASGLGGGQYDNRAATPSFYSHLAFEAGGGFNAVLVASGVGRAIAAIAVGSHASPLLLAWIVAALIRVATGSATVAMTTAAGIVAPIAVATPGTNAQLLVLATGAGALVLSHVNDAGFWLIKEFFNMTVPQTLKTWTVAETIIGVAGLAFTLLFSLVV